MGKKKTKAPVVFDQAKKLIYSISQSEHPILSDARLSIDMFDEKSFPEVVALLSNMIKENPEFNNIYFEVCSSYDGYSLEFSHRRLETDAEVSLRKKFFDDMQEELARIENARKEKEDAARRKKEQEKKDALDAKNRQEYEQYLLLKEKFGDS